jgi:DNA-binding NtrC family response regulator
MLFASAEGSEVGSVSMPHVSPGHAPEIPPQPSLAPNEIVPLLIGSTVGEIERELVLQTLARCDGNRTRAARVLGVSVRTLRNKIRQYSAEGIDVPVHSD